MHVGLRSGFGVIKLWRLNFRAVFIPGCLLSGAWNHGAPLGVPMKASFSNEFGNQEDVAKETLVFAKTMNVRASAVGGGCPCPPLSRDYAALLRKAAAARHLTGNCADTRRENTVRTAANNPGPKHHSSSSPSHARLLIVIFAFRRGLGLS